MDIINHKGFKSLGKNKFKKQIILIHSSTKFEDYFSSLKYRLNGKYNKIPNYIIDRKGRIHRLLNNNEFSENFKKIEIDGNSIIICLENLGWLQKEPLNNQYVNWIGDIYKGDVYEKKWRDYFFWHPYTEEQIINTAELCLEIKKELSIKMEFVGHNTKINGIEKFEGITTRSNYDSETTDINPSFNFDLFIKKLQNEQLTR